MCSVAVDLDAANMTAVGVMGDMRVYGYIIMQVPPLSDQLSSSSADSPACVL